MVLNGSPAQEWDIHSCGTGPRGGFSLVWHIGRVTSLSAVSLLCVLGSLLAWRPRIIRFLLWCFKFPKRIFQSRRQSSWSLWLCLRAHGLPLPLSVVGSRGHTLPLFERKGCRPHCLMGDAAQRPYSLLPWLMWAQYCLEEEMNKVFSRESCCWCALWGSKCGQLECQTSQSILVPRHCWYIGWPAASFWKSKMFPNYLSYLVSQHSASILAILDFVVRSLWATDSVLVSLS